MEESNDLSLKAPLSAKRESKRLDFKERFDPNQASDWCYIVKHIVAMANSGGGIIIFGIKNNGLPSGHDVSNVLEVDPAHFIDQIAKYTGNQFDNLVIYEADKKGAKIAILKVGAVSPPMVFIQPGTYATEDGKQKSVFSKGTVYFRHGAKSEPGNSEDLKKWLEKELNLVKKSWLRNVRKVVNAPIGHKVQFVAPERIWDESAYQSPQEILVGALKSWRRDKTSYASESDIWTLYSSRTNLQLDEERAECILESAINRHAPFFYFAQFLSHERLDDFIKRVAASGKYPAPNMVAKLAYVFGGRNGRALLSYIAERCNYSSTKRISEKLQKTVSNKNRLSRIYGTKLKTGTQFTDVSKVKLSDLEQMMTNALNENNRTVVKQLDAFLYGRLLERRK